MSQAMWNELQEIKARVAALEEKLIRTFPAPGMEALMERLDKFEKILGKHTAPKRG